MRRSICVFAAALFLATVEFSTGADDKPVGHWRFDAAAKTAVDLSGHAHAAQVSGGAAGVIDGCKSLALDGSQKIVVPSFPDLNLKAGFSIEMKVLLSDASRGQTLLFREGQYCLRINPPKERGQLSFFTFAGGAWEPRAIASVSSSEWLHIFATWDGQKAWLWVNAVPHFVNRAGNPPAAGEAPLIIGSASPHGPGIVGAIEYVKIYPRTLSSKEIIQGTFGDGAANVPKTTAADFNFSGERKMLGWKAFNGATASISENNLAVSTKTSNSAIINNRLNLNVDKLKFISLRMSVDKGGRATLIFVTTKNAGIVPFQTFTDGKPHNYVLDLQTINGWGGDLLVLGLMPSNLEQSRAKIERLQVEDSPRCEPEVRIDRIFTDSTLARAARPERIAVRLKNHAGPAKNLTATLSAPAGVAIKTPSQSVSSLDYNKEVDLLWDVNAAKATAGEFRVQVSGDRLAEPLSATQILNFHAPVNVAPASYVPTPVPAKTKYEIWAHYCALWKHGTHIGWKAIEPWPERKPVIGWYNEGTPEVADWHIKFMVEHGITGVIYCWYRQGVNCPIKQSLGHALDDGLMKARYRAMMKFGIMWENGCASGVSSVDDMMKNVLPFWIDNYFSNPQYIRVDGRPVLYVWVPNNFRKQLGGSENVRKALDLMRAECKCRGLGGLYLVACAQSQDKKAMETLAADGWDATSAYGNTWRQPDQVSMIGEYSFAPFEGFVDQQEALWKFKRELNLLPDITVAMMGWDSRPWKSHPFFWSENTPEKFRELCRRAKATVDASAGDGPQKNTVLFCCWNEFGEGHYIEPTRGNGFSYLDAIRDVFCDEPKEHIDLVPRDVGLAQPESWYEDARRASKR